MRSLFIAMPMVILAGCQTVTPGEMSVLDRVIAGIVEGCRIVPVVSEVTEIVTNVVTIGQPAQDLIIVADALADAICEAFRTDPRSPVVEGVPLTPVA